MNEFYILTTASFLEIILATLLILEMQNKTKELKQLTVKIDNTGKSYLEDLKKARYQLEEFNKTFEEKLTLNAKNLEVINELFKEISTEAIFSKFFFKKSNVWTSSLDKVWKHKNQLFWLLLSVFLLGNKKTA